MASSERRTIKSMIATNHVDDNNSNHNSLPNEIKPVVKK